MAGSRGSNNTIRYLSPFVLLLILTKAVLRKGKDGRGHLHGHYTLPAWSSQNENCMYPNIFLVDTLRYTG